MISQPSALRPGVPSAPQEAEVNGHHEVRDESALQLPQPGIVAANRLLELRSAATAATAPYDALSEELQRQTLRRRSIFLTGTQTGDGTTATATNLAAALSRQGESVLLVELRLTAPNLLHLLGDPADVHGLEDGLRGLIPVSDCMFTVADSSLMVIAAKKAMPETEAFAQSGPLNDFLEWAESSFEWMVVDCPPVFSSAWTRWFDLNADPVLMVVRSGVTREKAVKRVARQLGDRLAGAILTDSPA